jgi:hypothetical protein
MGGHGEEGESTEVRLLASLIGSARFAPPMPSLRWQQRTGAACGEEAWKSRCGEPDPQGAGRPGVWRRERGVAAGSTAATPASRPAHFLLAPEASGSIAAVWRRLSSTRPSAPRLQDEASPGPGSDDEDAAEEDVMGWLRELCLSQTEQEALCELAQDAPSLVQLQRVFSLFQRISTKHRAEIKSAAARPALPPRREQIAEDKKLYRREQEAFRHEQMALRREWQEMAADRDVARPSPRCSPAKEGASCAHANEALQILRLEAQVRREREISRTRRRWHLGREDVMRSCANDPLWTPQDAHRMRDAVLALLGLAGLSSRSSPEHVSLGLAQSPSAPAKGEADRMDEYMFECAALCGAGAQACARAGRRLLSRRSVGAGSALLGNGVRPLCRAFSLEVMRAVFARYFRHGSAATVRFTNSTEPPCVAGGTMASCRPALAKAACIPRS